MSFSEMPKDYQLFLASVDLMKREFRRYIHGAYWLTFAFLVAAMTFSSWPILEDAFARAPELILLFAWCLFMFCFVAYSARESIATEFADQLHLKFRRDQFDHFLDKRTFKR